MLSPLNTQILGPNGLPARRPQTADTDYAREYTAGSSSSHYGNLTNANGLERLYGSVDEMDLKLGWDAKEQMDNDPYCSAALDTRALGAVARPVEVEPAPKAVYASDADEKMASEVAEFVRRDVRYLKERHRDLNLTAFQLLRTAGKIGHVKAEIVDDIHRGGVDNGKRTTHRIKVKNRHNSCFVVDRQNNIVGIAAFTGEYSIYHDPYASVTLNGFLRADILGAGWELLPRDKWVVVTNRPPEDDSPLGRSLYRAAYTAYRMKRDTWPMYLKSLDNTALPHLVSFLPEREYAQDTFPLVNGYPDTAAAKVPHSHAQLQALEAGRQAGISVLEHGAEAKYLIAAQSGDPFMVALSVFNADITQAILLQGMATTQSKTGAYAMAQVQQDVLDLAMRHDRRMICDALDRDYVGPLVRKNFPQRYWHLMPHISFGEVELNDFVAWATAFAKLVESGLAVPSQFPHIWAVLGMPQGDLEEFYQSLEVDDSILKSLMKPTVKADGTEEPPIYEKYTQQEMGKRLTRNIGRGRAGRTIGGLR